MRPRDEVRREYVQQWLLMAEDDLTAAQDDLNEGKRYRWIICYHAQQAAEKYIKAYLIHRGIEPPRVHDLAELLQAVAAVNVALADELREVRSLSVYATETRYPGDAALPTEEEAQEAVRLAAKAQQAVLEAVRRPG